MPRALPEKTFSSGEAWNAAPFFTTTCSPFGESRQSEIVPFERDLLLRGDVEDAQAEEVLAEGGREELLDLVLAVLLGRPPGHEALAGLQVEVGPGLDGEREETRGKALDVDDDLREGGRLRSVLCALCFLHVLRPDLRPLGRGLRALRLVLRGLFERRLLPGAELDGDGHHRLRDDVVVLEDVDAGREAAVREEVEEVSFRVERRVHRVVEAVRHRHASSRSRARGARFARCGSARSACRRPTPRRATRSSRRSPTRTRRWTS